MTKFEKDKQLYLKIWRKNKYCRVTGRYLGSEPLTTFFHHILSKSKYPQYRWCEWNILILAPEIHAQVEANIDLVPEVKSITEEFKSKHLKGELQKCEK